MHAGGLKDGPVLLYTSKNHTLAHFYSYLSYGDKGDLTAYKMRWNQKIGKKEKALLAVEKNKELKNLFWNRDWQSVQGAKGGKRSGQKNALLYRQGYIMKETIRRFTYWEFTYNNEDDKNLFLNNKKDIINNHIIIHEDNNDFVIFKIEPQITFTKLVKILNQMNLVLIKDVSYFSKIARGQRKKYYNWQLVAIEINWNFI